MATRCVDVGCEETAFAWNVASLCMATGGPPGSHVIAVEHAPGLVTGRFHGQALWHARVDHVPGVVPKRGGRQKQTKYTKMEFVATADLETKIKLILSNVDPAEQVYTFHKEYPRASPTAPPSVVTNPADVEMKHEQVGLLKTLHGQCSPEEKSLFVTSLIEGMAERNLFVVVVTLLHTGHLGQFVKALATKGSVGQMSRLRQKTWAALTLALSIEPNRFTDSDLTNLDEARHADASPLLGQTLALAGQVIIRIRYLRLKKELLEGVNPEINTDKEVLVSRMEQLGFRTQIVEALQELERKVYGAGKPLDFKGCMDLARTIFEEIVEDAAKQAAAVKHYQLPPCGSGNFQPWYQILVSVGALSSKEGEVLQKLYNLFSVVGAHQLESAPEQVRITKNTIIEWGLLIVGRVQALK